MKSTADAVVVGGGISGLCAAYWLRDQGLDVVVLERDGEAGGTMKTVRENGFLIETGPNSALETTPLIRELVAAHQLEDEFVYAGRIGKKRYILKNGRLVVLPLGPLSFLRTDLFSGTAKLRLLKEPFIGRAGREESVADFVTRRLGREFLDYAIDPFVAGVYAGKPEALSVRAAFPKLYALEERYGGLIKGMIRGRRERKARGEAAKDRAESFSFRNGMQVFPRALAGRLGSRFLPHTRATSVVPGPDHFTVAYTHNGVPKTLHTRAVIFSIPAYAASDLVRPFSPETAEALSAVRYAPVASVFVGYRREDVGHQLDGFGFLVPSCERRKILGCLWSSSLFESRAPEGMVGVTAFVGGSRQPEFAELDDEAICDLVLNELKNIMQIVGNHVYLRVTRWNKAIPQYELGYLDHAAAFSRCEERFPGVYFCSNFRGGISVGDCIKSAHETAVRAGGFLRERALHTWSGADRRATSHPSTTRESS